jgi:hypothetical protein
MREYQYILTDLNTSNVKILEANPADAKDLTRSYDRDSNYHGIFRMYTGSQRFINEGGEILDKGGYWFLKNIWERDRIKGRVKVERKKINRFKNTYDNDLVAVVDFIPEAGFFIDYTEQTIDLTLIDSSKLQKFAANDEKNINLLSLNSIDNITVPDFANSPKIANLIPFDVLLQCNTSGTMERRATDQTTNIVLTNNYVRNFTLNELGERYFETGEKIYEKTFNIKYDWTITGTGTPIAGFMGGIVDYRIIGEHRDSSNFLKLKIEYHQGTIDFEGFDAQTKSDNGSVDTTDTLTFNDGDFMNIYIELDINNMSNITVTCDADATVEDYTIIETYESISETETECFLTHELAQRAIQILTSETDTAKLLESSIFGRTDSEFQTYLSDGDLAYLGTSYGFKVRNFPDSSITLNFKDWFKSIDRMANIALWFDKVNDRFRIEEKEQVYKDELILDLGTVSEFKIRPWKEGYFTQLLTGTREKGDYEEIQGAQEYNIQSEHSSDFPVKDKLVLRVPYNIDSLSIELCRRSQYKTTGSTDTKHDNKVLIFDLDSNLETIQNGTGYSGFLKIEDRYNGKYTPKKCLSYNGNWIAGIFEVEPTGKVVFRNNTKDINITSPFPFGSEQGDVSQDDTGLGYNGAPLFYPVIYECKFTIDKQGIDAIETDPHGYFKFNSADGEIFYGYLRTLQIKDFTGEAEATLIKANINR